MAPAMRAVSPCCSRPDQDQFASAFSVAEPSPGALGRDRQGIPVRNEFTRPAPSLTSPGYLPSAVVSTGQRKRLRDAKGRYGQPCRKRGNTKSNFFQASTA